MVGNIGGLLSVDPGQLYGNPNVQDPAVQQALANRGLQAAVGTLGQLAMPTRMPTPIGAVLGQAFGAAGPAEDAAIKARTDAMQGQLYGAQAAQQQAYLKQWQDPNSPLMRALATLQGGGGGPGAPNAPLMPNQPPPAGGGPGVSSDPSGTLALLNGPLGDKVNYYAKYYGLDPKVFGAMINTESSGNPNALNKSSGAAGLGQIIPSNFAKYGVKDPYNVDQNLDASAHLLSDNLKAANGDMNLALKYYFAGQDQSKWGKNTEAYPGLVMSRVPPAQPAAATPAGGSGAAAAAAPGGPGPGGHGTPTPLALSLLKSGAPMPGPAAEPTFAPGVAPGGAAPAAAGGGAPAPLPYGIGGPAVPPAAPGPAAAAGGGGAVGSPLGPGGPSGAQLAGLLGLQQGGAPARFAGPGAAEPAPAPAPGGPNPLAGLLTSQAMGGGGVPPAPGAASTPSPAPAPPAAAPPPPGPPGAPPAAPAAPSSLLTPPAPPAIPRPPTLPAAVAPTGAAATGGLSPQQIQAGQAIQLIGALSGHPELGQLVTSSPGWAAAVEAAKAGAQFPYQSALETQKGQNELEKTFYQGGINMQTEGYKAQATAVWGMIRDQLKPEKITSDSLIWNPALQSYVGQIQKVDPTDNTMHRYLAVIGPNSQQVQQLDLGQAELSPGQKKQQELTAAQQPIAVGPQGAPGAAPGSTVQDPNKPIQSPRGTLIPPNSLAAPISGTTDELNARSKDFAETVDKWGNATSGNYQTLQRLDAMTNALKVYQSGPISEHLSEIRNYLNNAGITSFDSWFQNPADAQIIIKNNIQAAIGQLDASGFTRQTQGELFALQKNLANPGLTPAANQAILAQGIGIVRWEQAMMDDWADAKRAGWRDPQDFERNWDRLNPLNAYVTKAQADIGPLRGMPGNTGTPQQAPPQPGTGTRYIWNPQTRRTEVAPQP